MPDMHPAPDISDLRPDLQSRRPAAPPPQRPPVATAWLQTHSGGAFDLLLPTRDAVRLGDIAHSLARIARFLGHTVGGQIWSVADHSLLVADLVRLQPAEHTPSALLLAALLHDAHEAYLGDVIRPVQDLIRARAPRFLDIWADTVFSVQSVIHAAIGLPTVLPASWIDRIHAADRAALAIEHRDVMAPGHDWNDPLPPDGQPPFAVWHGIRSAETRWIIAVQANIAARHALPAAREWEAETDGHD